MVNEVCAEPFLHGEGAPGARRPADHFGGKDKNPRRLALAGALSG